MASNRIQYTIGFKADTTAAERAIKNLMAQLSKFQQGVALDGSLNPQLTKAVAAAEQLEIHLKKAYNVNTGKINFTALNNSLKSAGTSVTQLAASFANCGGVGEAALQSLARAVATMEIPLKHTNALLASMMASLKSAAKYQLSIGILQGIQGVFSNSISYVKDLNGILNDIRIVTGQSADDMVKFAEAANKAAKELSVSTKDYAKASLIYYQQGDSAEMVAKKAAITTKAANVAFSASAQEMSEMLTAVWNSYQAGEDELERYVDIMAALGSKTATSTEEIAGAMQKVAATANVVGVSMEQMSSIIATVSSVTREAPESIGTSYKTILARIGDLKLGKTLDDGVTLGKVSGTLKQVGINVLDANKNLRDMGAVIEEIGEKWNTFTTAQQTAISQVIGGKRQYTQWLSLMDNWDTYLENLDIAKNSKGTLEEQFSTYQDSWEAASKKMTASTEGLWSTLVPEKELISMTKSLAGVVDKINEIVKGFGGLKGIIVQVAGALTMAFSNQIGASISGFATRIKDFKNSFSGMVNSKGELASTKDKIRSFFTESTAQREYRTQNATLSNMLEQQRAGANPESYEVKQAEATQLLLNKRLELMANERNLTDAQKEAANSALNSLSQEIDKTEVLRQKTKEYQDEYEQAKQKAALSNTDYKNYRKSLQALKNPPQDLSNEALRMQLSNQAGNLLNGNQKRNYEGQPYDTNYILSANKLFEQYSNANPANANGAGLDNLIERFGQLVGASRALSQVSSYFESFNKSIVKGAAGSETQLDNLEQSLVTLKTAITNLGGNEDAIQPLINDFAKLREEAQNGKTIDFTSIITQLQKFLGLSNEGQYAIQQLFRNLGLSEAPLDKVGSAADNLTTNLLELFKALRNVNNGLNNLPDAGTKFQAFAKGAATFASSISMSLSSFSNMIGSWDSMTNASRASSVAMASTNIISAIASLDPARIVGAVTGAAIGWVIGSEQAAEEAAKKIYEQAAKEASKNYEQSQKNQKTYTDKNDVLKNYQKLYEDYSNGGDTTLEDLQQAMLQVADAFGILGSSLAIASGDFETFNLLVNQTIEKNNSLKDSIKTTMDENEGTISELLNFPLKSRGQIGDYSTIQNESAYLLNAATDESQLQTRYKNAILKSAGISSKHDEKYKDDFVGKVLSVLLNGKTSITSYQDLKALNEALSEEGIQQKIQAGLNTTGYASKVNSIIETLKTIILMDGVRKEDGFRVSDTTGFNLEHIDTKKNDNVYWENFYQGNADESIFNTYKKVFNINENNGHVYGVFAPALDSSGDEVANWYEEVKKARNDILKRINNDRSKLTDAEREMLNILDSIVADDSVWTQAVDSYLMNAKIYHELVVQSGNIRNIIGKNQSNTTFSNYVKSLTEVIKYIEEHKDEDVFKKQIDKYIEMGMTSDEAFTKIAGAIVNQWASFDDYNLIVQSLTENFANNQEQLQQAIDYVSTHNIKKAADVNGALIAAMKYSFLNGGNLQTNEDLLSSILEANEADRESSDSRYEKYKTGLTYLKEDMEVDDVNSLYKVFWENNEENIMAWNDFIKLDYDKRKAYLERITREAKKNTQTEIDAARKEATEARDIWKEKLGGDAGVQVARTLKSLEDSFVSDLNTFFTLDENGKYLIRSDADTTVLDDLFHGSSNGYPFSKEDLRTNYYHNTAKTILKNAGIIDSEGNIGQEFWTAFFPEKSVGTTDEFINDLLAMTPDQIASTATALEGLDLSEQQIQNINDFQRAWSLIASDAESAATQTERLVSAIKELPTNIDDLEKIAKVLYGSASEQSMQNLIHSTSVERAEKVLDNLSTEIPEVPVIITQKRSEIKKAPANQQYSLSLNDEGEVYQPSLVQNVPEKDYAAYLQELESASSKWATAMEVILSQDYSQLSNYTSALTALTNAYSNFYQTGKLSTEAKSALVTLGIDPDSVKDISDLEKGITDAEAKIDTARQNIIQKIQKDHPNYLTNNINWDDISSWDNFYKNNQNNSFAKEILDNEDVANVLKNWISQMSSLRFLMDDFDSVAIKAGIDITNNIQAATNKVEELTTTAERAKNAFEQLSSAFGKDENLSYAARQILEAAKLTQQYNQWQIGISTAQGQAIAGKNNLGVLLSAGAMSLGAQVEALQAQQVKIDNFMAKAQKGHFFGTPLASSLNYMTSADLRQANERYNYIPNLAEFMLSANEDKHLTYDEDELNKVLNKYFADDTQMQKKIQEILKNHQGQDFSLKDLFDELQKYNNELDLDIQELVAGMNDSIEAALTTQIELEQAAAQEVLDIWENTYNAIAAARKGVYEGNTIIGSLYQNEDQLSAYIINRLNQGYTYDQIQKELYSNDINEIGKNDISSYDMEDYAFANGDLFGWYMAKNYNDLSEVPQTIGPFGAISTSNQPTWADLPIYQQMVSDLEKMVGTEQLTEKMDEYNNSLPEDAKITDPKEFIKRYVNQVFGITDSSTKFSGFSQELQAEWNKSYGGLIAKDNTLRYGSYQQSYEETQTYYNKQNEELEKRKAALDAFQSSGYDIAQVEGTYTSILSKMGITNIFDYQKAMAQYNEDVYKNQQETLKMLQSNGLINTNTKNGTWEMTAAGSALGSSFEEFMKTLVPQILTYKQSLESTYSDALGLSVDEMRDWIEAVRNMVGEQTSIDKMTDSEAEAFYKLAAKIKLAEDGFSTLQATSKDTWKILNKQTKVSTSEYNKTLSAMKSSMSKIFGVDLKKLTNKFVEDHLDELHKMATGTEKEALAAQDAIQDDLVAAFMETEGLGATVTISVDGVPTAINILDLFQNQLDQWDGKDIGFTITPDMTPAIDSMNSLIQTGTMTATQINEALNKIGWEPKITWQKVQMVNDTATEGMVTVQDDNGKTYTVRQSDVMTTNNETYIPIIGSATKITAPGGGPRPNLSGGGGGKAKKLDKKDPEDEIERYHHVNKTLDRLSNQLDEVDKKKSRIYGKSYLDYISQEIALTEKQCDTYQRYIDEAKEYLKLDTERVVSLGAIFDEYGNIANYDQVMQNILDAYNAFIDEYNAMDADTQQSEEVEQRKEDWDKWYDEKKKWIENYEETVQTIYEQNNNLLDAQNKISEKMLEGIQYKVEIHVELTDAEKEYLDYVNDKYEEILMKQGEAMSNLVKETDLTVSNLAALGKEKEELDAAFASGKLNQANYIDGLKDLNSQVLDNLSTLQELKTSIEEFYGTTLETATSDFDKQTAKVKAASEAMSSYISILALVGKGSNLKELTKFYDSQYQYNLQSLQMQQEYLNTLKKEEQYYLERMNSAEGLTETERKQYEALEETLNNVQSNILSDTQSTLQAIAEAFNNEVEIIISDLEKMIAGSDSSLQDLADAYSYYQEEQGRYVTSARELYEVNKLNRNIEKTMATTTSTVNKNLLAALQERINKQSEENELTEYNVEMNQLQYELLLKKIALEEAQNAKNTVRLTRDAGGNYVYQYTANQEDILSKEQEYEDVLQQINDLSVNRVRDLESQLLQIYQNTTQKMREIAEDQTLTEEEKYAKIQILMDQFKEQTNYIQEQYNIASAHLIKSNEVISEHYNKALVEHSQNAENGLNQAIAKMIENTQQFQQAMEDACTNKIPSAMDQMKDRIDSVTETTNSSYDSMADSLGNYNKVAEDAVDQNNKIADGLENEVLPAIHDITTAWDEYATKLKEVINVYEEMYQTIIKTLQAQGKLSNAEELKSQVQNQGNSSLNGGFTGETPDTKKPDTPSSNNGGGGGGGGNNPTNGAGTGGTNANTLSIIYKALVTAGPSTGTSGGGVPIGPSTLKVGSTGTIKWNCADGYVQGGSEVSDPALAQISGNTITALAAGSVTVTLKYWDRNKTSVNTMTESTLSIINSGKHQLESKKADKVYGYATGGIADFTGPAWLDGTKSKPELVLSASDTQNILATVESVRKLDSSTLRLLNNYIVNASLAMAFGLSNMSAQSVLGGVDTLRQDVHITAEFPNATNSQEIEDAFDSLINRAAQFITTKN